MKVLSHIAALVGLSATLLVATPPAQRLIAESASTAAEVRSTGTPAVRQAAPTPAKEPVRPVSGWNNLLLRITRRKEEEQYYGFSFFRRGTSKRHNRRANRAALNNWN